MKNSGKILFYFFKRKICFSRAEARNLPITSNNFNDLQKVRDFLQILRRDSTTARHEGNLNLERHNQRRIRFYSFYRDCIKKAMSKNLVGYWV